MACVRTRFAPSPTGLLHLGHAYSAWCAFEFAQEQGGEFLLRIEDIDGARCRVEYEHQIFSDLQWLGLTWPAPVIRQSQRSPLYLQALERLNALDVTYRCTCRRSDIRAALSAPQEGAPALGPDGLVYPGTCRELRLTDENSAVRLNMARAIELIGGITFTETGPGRIGQVRVARDWLVNNVGDVVLARRDIGLSYHLAVVVDDFDQRISHVVRGEDLFEATAIHRVLQLLLGYPPPVYHHHKLVRDASGKRLAKRDDARAIARYRKDGLTPLELLMLAKSQL